MFSSYDIARKADVVFSEALSVDQFKELDKEGVHIIHRTDDIVFYKKSEILNTIVGYEENTLLEELKKYK